MNQFDFFYIQAYSQSIRRLTSMGISRDKIQTETNWNTRFPTKLHTASLHYIDVMNIGHDEARNLAIEYIKELPTVDGVNYTLRFQPVD